MTTYHKSSEAEIAARERLYQSNRALRGAVLDLLSIVMASDDPWPATSDMYVSKPERLRLQALQIERHDTIIHRAREIIEKTKGDKQFLGKLPSEEMTDDSA